MEPVRKAHMTHAPLIFTACALLLIASATRPTCHA